MNHVAGGLTIGSKENTVKLKAWPRIGILANHLRLALPFSFSSYTINVDVLDVYWMHNFSDAWKVARISAPVRTIQLFMPSWPFSRMMAYLNDKKCFLFMRIVKTGVTHTYIGVLVQYWYR